jgi:asparagine synthase (glutamine-hydrolysing)
VCGFSGFVSFGGNALDFATRHRVLAQMGQALARRGPDDQQFFDDGTLSLVFRRLSVVGGQQGRQPITNEDEQVLLACNGEIYNHQELTQVLRREHVFKTTSDCEVILHGYESWGDLVFQRVRGMFAGLIWDKRHHRLTLFRDRLGIKPLYYSRLNNGILFASEVKALLAHPLCPRVTDWEALEDDPLSRSAAPTYIKNIDFLPGGCLLKASEYRTSSPQTYWALDEHFGAAVHGGNEKAYRESYHQLLNEATLEHLQGQGPIGLHLSGGVDSALLASIASKQRRDLLCYTIVKRTSYLAGDVEAAKMLTQKLGVDWSPVYFNYCTVLERIQFSLRKLEELVVAMDSPLFDLEWLIKSELNRVIRTHHPDLKVVMLGQGADEFAGGYSRRIDRPFRNWEHYLADEVRPNIQRIGVHDAKAPGHHGIFAATRSGATHGAAYHQWMRLMLRQLQSHNLWHEDRTSSWFGLEARVPFLDHRLVELLASVPEPLHAQLFWNKSIVRHCASVEIPSYDVRRPKVGFCWTDDNRTLDIMAHGMASAVAADFVEQYVEQPDFAFDRHETLDLIRRVLRREPGFYSASFALLGRVTACIFTRWITSSGGKAPTAWPAFEPSQLEIVGERDWPGVHAHLSGEPVVPFPWKDSHQIDLPVGTLIRHAPLQSGMKRYEVATGDSAAASLSLPETESWQAHLLDRLSSAEFAGFTFQDWTDELNVSFDELAGFLNVLLQCGFVRPPTAEPAIRATALSQ